MEAKKDLARTHRDGLSIPPMPPPKPQKIGQSSFRKSEVPEDIEETAVSIEVTAHGLVRLDKLLAQCGLAESVSDAGRKLKQKSVKVNGEPQTEAHVSLDLSQPLILQVGRKKVRASYTGTKPCQ